MILFCSLFPGRDRIDTRYNCMYVTLLLDGPIDDEYQGDGIIAPIIEK